MTGKKKAVLQHIEILLAVLIAVCVIGLIYANDARNHHVEEHLMEMLFVTDEQSKINDKDLQKMILDYRPYAYKMIETYDHELNLVFRLMFNEQVLNTKDTITNHPDLLAYFKTHDEGHTKYFIGSDEVDVFYKWCDVEGSEDDQLIVIYASRQKEPNFWQFQMLCYMILIFTFGIVIISTLKSGKTRADIYIANQQEIMAKMRR